MPIIKKSNEAIKKWRKSKNILPDQLAAFLRIKPNYYEEYEDGTRPISINKSVILSELTQIPLHLINPNIPITDQQRQETIKEIKKIKTS